MSAANSDITSVYTGMIKAVGSFQPTQPVYFTRDTWFQILFGLKSQRTNGETLPQCGWLSN